MGNKKYYIVYKITNKINDKIYIGCHITSNVNDKYFGSGTNIKNAIKKYGKENFDKIIIHNCNSKEDMLNKERELVNEEFINRNDTYNIILGGGKINTECMVNVKDKNNNYYCVHKTDPRYLSGELSGVTKNNVTVKDKNGNKFNISIGDPRYLSGELVSSNKGMIIVKDKNDNNLCVSVNDPRYLSGELVGIWKNKKHNEKSKRKIGEANSINQKGEKNSQYGTCWIYNQELKESKKVKKNELYKWVNGGWVKGRKIKV